MQWKDEAHFDVKRKAVVRRPVWRSERGRNCSFKINVKELRCKDVIWIVLSCLQIIKLQTFIVIVMNVSVS
jgi:hypothetical protein